MLMLCLATQPLCGILNKNKKQGYSIEYPIKKKIVNNVI